MRPSTIPPSWEDQTSLSKLAPPPRSGAAFAYDGAPGAGYDVLFGGESLGGFYNDTWIDVNGSWSNVTSTACATVCPPSLAYAAMAYDPAVPAIVLMGGLIGCPGNGCGEGQPKRNLRNRE